MAFSLLQPLRELPLACLDVETTGASADFGHRVIELGIVRYEHGRKVAQYQQLIDPQRRIGAGVTALTGITQKMVEGQPTFAMQFPAAMELLRGALILGHNIRFDLSFLRKEFRRCGHNIVEDLPSTHVLDTVRIARRRFGRGGNGLQTLAPRLGITPICAHRALADAVTTAQVFERLMEPLGGWRTCLCDAIREQGGPMGLLPVNARESWLPLELEEALEQRKPVMMEYVDSRQTRTRRTIQPLHLRRRRGELLLVAHCELRGEQRTFKFERIVQLMKLNPDAPLTQVPVPMRPKRIIQPLLFDPPVVVTSRETVAEALEVVEQASVESGHVETAEQSSLEAANPPCPGTEGHAAWEAVSPEHEADRAAEVDPGSV
jgi:DNA polymerase-3 subunit epsilon